MSALFLRKNYECCVIKWRHTSRCIFALFFVVRFPDLWPFFFHCVCAQEVAVASAEWNKKQICKCMWGKNHFAWKDKKFTSKKTFLFLNRVSGTTTSSAVKPLGAGLYWKPVALTKNPTVVCMVLLWQPLVSDWLHSAKQLTPQWRLNKNCHISSSCTPQQQLIGFQ